MNRKSLVAAVIVAVAVIAGAGYATYWLLQQPVPPTEPVDEDEPVASVESTAAVSDPDEPLPTTGGTVAVKLYVLASSGQTLATDMQEIDTGTSSQEQAEQVVRLLLRRSAAMPRGVELRGLFITSQGVAYVDLSREVVSNHPGGSSAEELTVFGLTHTLITNFPTIKMVKILVEGREIQTLAGHLDLTIPYGRAPSYLQPPSERSDTRNEAS